MNGIIAHIEYLLTQHDCVIIPGLGGFIQRRQAAAFTADGKIAPPCKILGFNAALTHNDGLLADFLARSNQLTLQEALIWIESEVRTLQLNLHQGKTEQLNSLGVFCLGKEGELIFTPSQHYISDLSLFGFSSLTVKPLIRSHEKTTSIANKRQQEDSDIVLVPVNIRLLRRVSVVASLIIGLLFISHPLEYGDIPPHHASMVSADLLSRAIVPHFAYYQEQLADTINEVSISDDLLTSEQIESESQPIIESDNLIAQEVVNVLPAKPSGKRYYIIVGSFPELKQAEQRIAYLSRKGIAGVQYLLKDNKYRLYVNTFADKTQANEFLDELRASHTQFSDAWLLAHISR